MNEIQRKLQSSFIAKINDVLDSDGISESEEDRLIEILEALNDRLYTASEYQEVLAISLRK